MNDTLKGKSGKVKVMYVRSEESEKEGSASSRSGKSDRKTNPKAKREGSRDRGASARERSKPYERANREKREDRQESSSISVWKATARPEKPRIEENPWVPVEEEDAKKRVDPEVIRRQRAEETRVYGENACQALFEHRPEAIVRAWFVQSVTPRFKETLRWLAANRKAYHVVEPQELAKAAGTEHHGGVCFIIKKRKGLPAAEYLRAQTAERDCVLALEEVGNPHNLGGIMRSCAHFGVNGLILQDAGMLESGAAVRTAEGGAEHLQAIDAATLSETLKTFRRAGYTIVTTSSHKGVPLSQAKLPAKMVLVLGQESDGLSDSTWQAGDLALSIDGTGRVESLNVSVAAGVLLSAWWCQTHQ